MTATADMLATWREEIAAELEDLQKQLPALREQLAAAHRARATARDKAEALVELAARGMGSAAEGQARCLHSRVEAQRRALLEAPELDVGTPAARIKALEDEIADHALALAQLSRALEPEPRAPVRQLVPRAREVPPDHGFDIIPAAAG